MNSHVKICHRILEIPNTVPLFKCLDMFDHTSLPRFLGRWTKVWKSVDHWHSDGYDYSDMKY